MKKTALILCILLSLTASAQLKSAQSVVAQFLTLRGDGALADADALPTGVVVVNGVDNGAAVTVANVTTGEYKATVTLPALTAGDIVQLRANYTIDGIATGQIVRFHVGDTIRLSDGVTATAIPDVQLATPQDHITPAQAGDEMTADLTKIHGTALTETPGQIAAAFTKFYDVATPTGTVNSIPDAVAGASGGLAIVGSKMDLNDAPNATAVTAFRTEMEKSGTQLKALYDVRPATAPPTKTELDTAFTEIKGAGWTTQTLVAIVTAIGSGGITSQEVRDAMKLAPSAGAAAADSIDDKIGDVQTSADAAARPGDEMDLVNAPNATALLAVATKVWDHLYSAATTTHSIGKALVTWLSTGGIPGSGI